MARKRKPLPLLADVLITDVAAEGNALGRVDDMVVFVPFAAPGDVVDIQVEKKKKRKRKATPLAVWMPCASVAMCVWMLPAPTSGCAAVAAGSICPTTIS